jgi:hypothetical protein
MPRKTSENLRSHKIADLRNDTGSFKKKTLFYNYLIRKLYRHLVI